VDLGRSSLTFFVRKYQGNLKRLIGFKNKNIQKEETDP